MRWQDTFMVDSQVLKRIMEMPIRRSNRHKLNDYWKPLSEECMEIHVR